MLVFFLCHFVLSCRWHSAMLQMWTQMPVPKNIFKKVKKQPNYIYFLNLVPRAFQCSPSSRHKQWPWQFSMTVTSYKTDQGVEHSCLTSNNYKGRQWGTCPQQRTLGVAFWHFVWHFDILFGILFHTMTQITRNHGKWARNMIYKYILDTPEKISICSI